ncbi:hypothetical protein M9979_12135 [Sphingomonas sp. RP10(2022)]|uniref:Uncharacterized protein n=1 Tax=Sphingomonas liriopis TaxID=2949094 RepID=A0A9X2HTJ7_9SPHN|nr:hypothetical protein [Sphingomonas liriopis]MCP3735622.1 hypothetical protein [Sphingomonas liriopis]
MADSTTPNLALTKMQPGTHRDDWGAVANENLDKIDTAVKAAKDRADGALPKVGGTVTGEILRDGQGAVLHWSDDAMDHGTAFLVPSTGTDPTGQPGDIWFGYTP